jgi:hypothetical protein
MGAQTPKLLRVGVSSQYVHNLPDYILVQLLGGFLTMDQAWVVIVEVEL